MRFNFFTCRDEVETCPHCGWSGKGRELRDGEFSEAHFILDLDCPKCHAHVGIWQSPMQREVDEWRRQYPYWRPKFVRNSLAE